MGAQVVMDFTWPNFEINGLDCQCCLAGSSKTAPRILLFSIAMGAGYSFYVKSVGTCAPTFFGYIILCLSHGVETWLPDLAIKF